MGRAFEARGVCCWRTILVLPTAIALGWPLGYRSVSEYLTFALLGASVALTAWHITRHFFTWQGVADAFVRVGVVAFAIIVACGLVLGGLGYLTLTMFCVLGVAALAASAFLTPSSDSAFTAPDPAALAIPVVALLAALLAFMVGFGATHSPLTLYDSLSYHLFFPARWLQDHRLSIIPTPFSDVAQAYAPANGELFFLWLMLPFHGDLLARIGQLPVLSARRRDALRPRAPARRGARTRHLPARVLHVVAAGVRAGDWRERRSDLRGDVPDVALPRHRGGRSQRAARLGALGRERRPVRRDEIRGADVRADSAVAGARARAARPSGVGAARHRRVRAAVVRAELDRGRQSDLSRQR